MLKYVQWYWQMFLICDIKCLFCEISGFPSYVDETHFSPYMTIGSIAAAAYICLSLIFFDPVTYQNLH